MFVCVCQYTCACACVLYVQMRINRAMDGWMVCSSVATHTCQMCVFSWCVLDNYYSNVVEQCLNGASVSSISRQQLHRILLTSDSSTYPVPCHLSLYSPSLPHSVT